MQRKPSGPGRKEEASNGDDAGQSLAVELTMAAPRRRRNDERVRFLVLAMLAACTSLPPDPGVIAPTPAPTTDCFGVTCAGATSCCFVATDDADVSTACAGELDAAASAYCTNGRADIVCQSDRDCPSNAACCASVSSTGGGLTTSCGSYTDTYDGAVITAPFCDQYVCGTDSDCDRSWGTKKCFHPTVNGVTLPLGACD